MRKGSASVDTRPRFARMSFNIGANLPRFARMSSNYTLKPTGKRKYHRNSMMPEAEVMLIMILFHDSGYRCFKHFYLEKVCKQLRHLFPKVVSYNRIVELERDVSVPLTWFIKKVLLGKCTGINFVDSTLLCVCKNQRSRASMYKEPLTHSSHYS